MASFQVLGETAGSMLGRDIETLIQRAREYKKEYGDSFVSVEHIVLSYADDRRFGRQLFKDFQISINTLKSAVQAIRGRQNVIDQGKCSWYAYHGDVFHHFDYVGMNFLRCKFYV